ncbi:MAG: hypothetical protein MZV63_33510 [Marinilabiliales bacterium]|nr:hypothetical protein [Marinilabiliales bacterium]
MRKTAGRPFARSRRTIPIRSPAEVLRTKGRILLNSPDDMAVTRRAGIKIGHLAQSTGWECRCASGARPSASWRSRTTTAAALLTKGRDAPGIRRPARSPSPSTAKRTEEEIKTQLLEKEILLKEVHHRIKNNIASIGGLLSLRLKSITNPEAIAALQDAVGRVESMRILYEKLLLSAGYKDIPVKMYVESRGRRHQSPCSRAAPRSRSKSASAIFILALKRLFPLGLIINELITNKMKYAFMDKDTGVDPGRAHQGGRAYYAHNTG